jgi:hypothetical protein
MIKKILQRLVVDPILTVHIIGKRCFWNYFWLLATGNLIASLIVSATGGGQMHLGWREAFFTTTSVGLFLPFVSIAMAAILVGKETFLYELEDFIHVVSPNFSFNSSYACKIVQ